MPHFDPDRMLKLISLMRESVAHLSRLRDVGKDVFLADSDKLGSAKYHFIVAIESAIDMSNHLISRNGFRVPEDYADSFTVMAEAGALDREFAEQLKEMARFRNRLVHLYWKIDEDKVYDILKTRLGDFKLFLESMSKFLGFKEL